MQGTSVSNPGAAEVAAARTQLFQTQAVEQQVRVNCAAWRSRQFLLV
jgi:hypothetical protein